MSDAATAIDAALAHLDDAIGEVDDDAPKALVDQLQDARDELARAGDGLRQLQTPGGNFVRAGDSR